MRKELDALVKLTGKSRSEVLRDAVRRQLALQRFVNGSFQKPGHVASSPTKMSSSFVVSFEARV